MTLEYWDSHLHLHPFRPEWWAEKLVENMERNHVRAGAISGVALFNPGADRDVLAAARKFPGRFLPMLSAIDLNNPAELARITPMLDTGEWAGVGELFLEAHASDHLAFATEDGETRQMPYPTPRDGARNRVLGGLIRYCAEHSLPILIHGERAAALEELLWRYPESTILWAHCDYVTPLADVRRVFSAHPWLQADFGPMIRCGYWDAQNSGSAWLETDLPFWRRMGREFGRRMLLGTDTIVEKYCAAERYKHIYDSYADFLAPLGGPEARAIAGGNFKRVFGAYLKTHPEIGA